MNPLHPRRRQLLPLWRYQKSLEECAMKSLLPLISRRQPAAFRIAGLMLAIALVWLMPLLNISLYGQNSENASNSDTGAASPPADWPQFHLNNMQRWNTYEALLG